MNRYLLKTILCVGLLCLMYTQTALASPVDLLGDWKVSYGADTLNYTGSLLVFQTQQPNGQNFTIGGHFDWYRGTSYAGTEIFTGTFFADMSLDFSGTQLINPNGIGLAHYHGLVTADGNNIVNGTWYPPTGAWTATRTTSGLPEPDAALLLVPGVFGLVGLKRRYLRCLL